MVLEYTTRLLRNAVDSAVARGKVKPGSKSSAPVAIGAEDILFLVRKVRPWEGDEGPGLFCGAGPWEQRLAGHVNLRVA